ncbi:MAG: SPFH domain-containing protein [Planctomycetes bacterium]|nr:SPFH domain-containing protein [Planctomycetota bacterium]
MQARNVSKEVVFEPISGYPVLALTILLFATSVFGFIRGGQLHEPSFMVLALGALLLFVLILPGFFIIEPNMGRVLVLFGRYRGTARKPGFWYTNPFTSKKKISLRVHNLNGKTLKVNDLLGNPIEIGAITVWQVSDSAQALFDVVEFEKFVEVQAESAVRFVASKHPYDDDHTAVVASNLRGSADIVAQELQQELQQRLDIAGIHILEARLSHLAYAPEIASAMLQRQQAGAIIAARKLIVDGAVGMVEHALQELSKNSVVHLDDERKATLTGNLLVVLCGHQNPVPVVNTGSLYT